MNKILFFVALMLLSLPVYSADWQLDSTGSFEIDKDSILKTKNSVKAWVKIDDKGRYGFKKYINRRTYLAIDCQNRTASELYIALYDKNGDIVLSYDLEKENKSYPERIIPDSYGEMLYIELCSYLKKK